MWYGRGEPTALDRFHRVDPRLRVLKSSPIVIRPEETRVSSRRPEVEGTEIYGIMMRNKKSESFIA